MFKNAENFLVAHIYEMYF